MTKENICGRVCPTLYKGFGVGCNPTLSIYSVGGAVTGWSYMYVVGTVDFLGVGI